jgi:hypothetical protein
VYSILGEVGHEDNGGLGVVLAHGICCFHAVDSRKLDIEEDEVVMCLIAASEVEGADLAGDGALDPSRQHNGQYGSGGVRGLVAVLDDKNPMYLASAMCRLR